jgi:Kef-type K+ transport system membrane component KefB
VVGGVCYYSLGWNHRQAEIGGLALSTTSLAVVYAVLVETGLNRELVGKRLMSATFVTDIATVLGLTVLFIKPTVLGGPVRRSLARDDRRAAEGRSVVLLPVRQPGDRAGDQARLRDALPADVARQPRELAGCPAAFVLGLMMSGHYVRHRQEQERMRVVAFAFLTPFFFLKGGMNASASALWANVGVLAVLFVAKMIPKLSAVYPLARKYMAPHAAFTTLLMSTGLTVGTITSLYGLNAG